MNKLITVGCMALASFSIFAQEQIKEEPKVETCYEKVTRYYQSKYSKSISSPLKTKKRSRLFHAFAYPDLAFITMANKDENFMALQMNEEAKKECGATSNTAVHDTYVELLKSGKLCNDMEKKNQPTYWKEAKTLRVYILDEVSAESDRKEKEEKAKLALKSF